MVINPTGHYFYIEVLTRNMDLCWNSYLYTRTWMGSSEAGLRSDLCFVLLVLNSTFNYWCWWVVYTERI